MVKDVNVKVRKKKLLFMSHVIEGLERIKRFHAFESLTGIDDVQS